MSHRPDPDTEPGGPAWEQTAPDSARRALLRGVAMFGLAGVTGTLSACGGGGEVAVTSAAGPAPDPVAEAPAKLPTKSEVYKRTPEARKLPKAPADSAGEVPDVAGPPQRDADLKPTAKQEAKDAKADAKAATKPAGEPPAASKSNGSQQAARAPKEAPADPKAKPAKPTKPAAPKPPPAPVVAETIAGAKTADIPVGGGRIYTKEKIVVTQPTKGDFKGFSAVCTHQNCLVTGIDAGAIVCACHGSRFGIEDGGVQRGPAFQALPAQAIAVHGDEIHPG